MEQKIPGLPLDRYNSIDKDKIFKGQTPDLAQEFLLPSNCTFKCTSVGLYDGANSEKGDGVKCLKDCLQVNLSCTALTNLIPPLKLFSKDDINEAKNKIKALNFCLVKQSV